LVDVEENGQGWFGSELTGKDRLVKKKGGKDGLMSKKR
jgi:hypothetical protein